MRDGRMRFQVHRKIRIETGQASNKMVFPNPNGSFGCILSVIVGGDKLEIHVGLAHEMFQGGRAFVVQFLQLWLESPIR